MSQVFSKPNSITGEHLGSSNGLNLTAIFSQSEIEAQINEISELLLHPVTLIEFKETDSRIDSTRSRILFQYCCEVLRVCANPIICKTCDKKYASLFKGIDLEREYLKETVCQRILEKKYEDDLYKNNGYGIPEFISVINKENYGYIQYNCPIMGLRELIFPLVVCNKILGVLFVGQMSVDGVDTEDEIISIRKNFLSHHSDIFDGYLKSFPEYSYDTIKNAILTTEDPRQQCLQFKQRSHEQLDRGLLSIYKPTRITESEFDNRIKFAIETIEKFERNLENKLYSNISKYVKSIFSDAINSSYSELQKDLPKDRISMESQWNAVKATLQPIVDNLGLKFISIYAMGNNSQRERQKIMDLVAYVPNKDSDDNYIEERIKKLKFDYSNLQRITYEKTSSTIATDFTTTNDGLFGCINSPLAFPNNCKEIFFYPVKANPSASVAVSIGFEFPLGDKHYNEIRQIVCNEIPSLITLISLLRTFFHSEVEREINEKTLRIYRHEISHLTLGLRNHNDKLAPPEYSILTYHDIDAVYHDNLSSLEQLGYFTQNTGVLLGSFTNDNLQISEFKVFGDLLFKWKSIYRRESRRKHIEFSFPSISLSDYDRPLISTDKRRLEQLIYNLVNNAMKYSYWGTRIYVDCKVIDHVSKKQCLSVVDYGHSIEEGDAPYGLYYRNQALVNKKVEGSGIGLYVAKEVARLIGVNVSHKPAKKMSEFNIPLMKYYLDWANPNNRIYDAIYKNYQKLKAQNVINEVSNENVAYKRPPRGMVFNEIENPTYKVEFEVII